MKGRNFLTFALGVADQAGTVLMKYHGKSLSSTWTSSTHFKTACDDENNRLARAAIGRVFPDHGIHSEEGELVNANSPYRWVVDGVDGTIGLRSGFTDHFSFCIALCKNAVPILGVVNAAARGELYRADDSGNGAFCNDKPIHVSDLTNINQVLMGVDSGKHDRTAHLPYMDRLLQPDGITCPMCTGCVSVPLCLVASGVLHAYLATSLEPEDMAASVAIIREAGGRVTNLRGEEWKLGDSSILAANPTLHDNLARFLGL